MSKISSSIKNLVIFNFFLPVVLGLTIWGRMDGFHHRKTEKVLLYIATYYIIHYILHHMDEVFSSINTHRFFT